MSRFAQIVCGILYMCFGCHMIFYLYYTYNLPYKNNQIYQPINERLQNRLVDMADDVPILRYNVNTKEKLQILFINRPSWIHIKQTNKYLKMKCYFNNCVTTDEGKNISKMSAIVFSAQDKLYNKSSFLKTTRSNSQVWIFIRMEPPADRKLEWYLDTSWKNTMNWSWGYRLDSDIFLPYQELTTKQEIEPRNYDAIFNRKTKLVAWAVSNCRAKSRRDEYVQALIKEGVHVDIFGKCSKNKTRIDKNEFMERVNKDYKFYLSFENNFCKDYVTEKFYTYFGLDTVLIVRGGLNYSEHFDKNAFIDTSAFPSVKSLARYIFEVSNDRDLYTQYLQNKDKYNTAGSLQNSISHSACKLCEVLNYKDHYKKIYGDIASYIHNGTCYNPKHIVG